MIASVSGRRRATVVPPPGSVAMSIVPRRLSIVFLTTSMPTPRPDRAEIVLGGREARREQELVDLLVGEHRAGRAQALLLGLGADACRVEPGAVVAHAHQHLGADMLGGQRDTPGRGLGGGGPAPGCLDAVVDGVADQVDERVGQPLDHGLVEFGVLAAGDELDRLAEIAREIVDEAAETAEQRADGDHADAHGGVAQPRRQALDLLRDALEAGIGAQAGELAQPGLGDDQFADPVHQLVEPLRLDPHAAGRPLLGPPRRRRRPGIGPGGDRRGGRSDGRRGGRGRRRGDRRGRDRRGGARLGRGGVRSARTGRLQGQDHLVAHEQEHVLDRRAGRGPAQGDVPAEDEALGIEAGEFGQGVEARHDRAGAEVAQLVEERERVGAVAQDVRGEGDADPPAVPGGLDGLGRAGRGGGRRADAVGVAVVALAASVWGVAPRSCSSSARMASPMIGARGLGLLDEAADVVLSGERDVDEVAADGTSPRRTRSKAVSKSWVKAATCSKPNMAPEPLIVCRARKAVSIRARSSGRSPRSSSVASRQASNSAASARKISAGSRAVMERSDPRTQDADIERTARS